MRLERAESQRRSAAQACPVTEDREGAGEISKLQDRVGCPAPFPGGAGLRSDQICASGRKRYRTATTAIHFSAEPTEGGGVVGDAVAARPEILRTEHWPGLGKQPRRPGCRRGAESKESAPVETHFGRTNAPALSWS